MALIKCSECGHDVSDKASACPNCGFPFTESIPSQDTVIEESKGKHRTILWPVIVLLLCLLAAGGYYVYTRMSKKENVQIEEKPAVADDKDSVVVLSAAFIKAIEKYDQFSIFSEGRAAVCDGNKWGYINTKGEEVIPATIDAYCVGRFSEGLAFVAHGNNNADFSIIERTGKTVFQGSGFYFDSEFPHSEDMPYYLKGQIFVPMTTAELFNIYDKEGNIIDTADFEEKDSYYRKNVVDKYTVFDSSGEGGQGQRKYGIKDSGGNVVVPAKYNGISGICKDDGTQIAYVSNGVALVDLIEIDEDYFTNNYKYSKSEHHYGYADLKGNDTFSRTLKERSKNAEMNAYSELAKQKAEEERLQKEGPEWLQGAWRMELYDDYGNGIGYMYEVFDHGTSKSYIENSLVSERQYTVVGNRVSYDKGYYELDHERHFLISANGKGFKKVSDNTSYIPSSSGSNSSGRSYDDDDSGSRSYRFSSADDVIGWLSDKTFYNGSRRLRIRPDGVWLNDYCATFAPRVERYESWKALIRASTATGQRLSFLVNPIDGEITDEAGDVFRLR